MSALVACDIMSDDPKTIRGASGDAHESQDLTFHNVHDVFLRACWSTREDTAYKGAYPGRMDSVQSRGASQTSRTYEWAGGATSLHGHHPNQHHTQECGPAGPMGTTFSGDSATVVVALVRVGALG